jgi:hypothetical protein
MPSKSRDYGLLRDPIEQRGGKMEHVREGHPWGARVVTLKALP